ncbi:MAG: universal stress protein [Polyangiaceae bacterium]|nr:universal stress protein [Polyangiaceae bacterium]
MSHLQSSKLVVLAAVDLAAGSTPVMDKALELAASHPLGILHVLTVEEQDCAPASSPRPPGPETPSLTAERTAAFCRQVLERGVKGRSTTRAPSVVVHAMVGWAAEEIVWLAAHLDADYIVMATHGRRGIKRLLLGSVAERVVRLANCPVVVVRHKQAESGWGDPEAEPICSDCATARAETQGRALWCDHHGGRHVRIFIPDDSHRQSPSP